MADRFSCPLFCYWTLTTVYPLEVDFLYTWTLLISNLGVKADLV